MISNKACAHAKQIAEQLNGKNVYLSTVPESPLDAVLEHSVPACEALYSQESDVTLQSIANAPDVRGALHDDVSEQGIATLAAGLSAQMKFLRGVVNPKVNGVFEAIKAEVEVAAAPEYTVVELEPREIYSSDVLIELLKPYTSTAYEVETFSGFPIKDAVGIAALLETGSTQFDSDLAGLIAERGDVWLEGVYNKYFVNGGLVLNQSSNRAVVDEYIVVHVLARNLIDTPVEGLNMSFQQYQNRMASLMSTAAYLAAAALESYQLLESNGVLVLEYPTAPRSVGTPGAGVIQVYGPVYREFIANGGTVEAVLGSSLGDKLTYASDFVEKQQNLAQRYVSHAQLAEENHQQALGARLKAAIGTQISKLIAESPVGELIGNESHEKAHARLRDYLTHYNDFEVLTDVYRTVRRILVNSMYPASNAMQWFETMDRLEKEDPSMNVRDIAYYTLVELVADYYAKQINHVQL